MQPPRCSGHSRMQSLKTRSAVDSLFSNASASYKNTSRSTSISASARTRGRSWSGSTIWKGSKQTRTALREHRLQSRSKRGCLARKLYWTSWGDEKDEAVNDACCQDGPRRGVFLISLLLTRYIQCSQVHPLPVILLVSTAALLQAMSNRDCNAYAVFL